jgi:hypothetical protein
VVVVVVFGRDLGRRETTESAIDEDVDDEDEQLEELEDEEDGIDEELVAVSWVKVVGREEEFCVELVSVVASEGKREVGMGIV